MNNPFSLEGKTILVTGASSGIGKAIAIECSKLGAQLFILGRNENRLKETFNELSGEGHEYIVTDLSLSSSFKEFCSIIPCLDGIVHCAGLTKILPFQFVTKEDLDEVMNVNFYAPAELSRLLLKNKKINKEGSVVFISSVSGVYCSAVASSIYSASKGAVNGLVKGMALDLAPKGIRVNCVNPGMVDTNILTESDITKEQLKEDMKRYPLKRYGKPEEIAYAVIYLLSDASKWVTGSNLLIDGGYTLL